MKKQALGIIDIDESKIDILFINFWKKIFNLNKNLLLFIANIIKF